MKCPRCDHDKTYVLKTTRPEDKLVDSVKQRRRVCSQCDRPFMTYEIHEEEFKRLCDLIKLHGPTRRPLKTRSPTSTPNVTKS